MKISNKTMFNDEVVSRNQICEKFNGFFLDSIQEISQGIIPVNTLEENANLIKK